VYTPLELPFASAPSLTLIGSPLILPPLTALGRFFLPSVNVDSELALGVTGERDDDAVFCSSDA
jgi:hypothetical protein